MEIYTFPYTTLFRSSPARRPPSPPVPGAGPPAPWWRGPWSRRRRASPGMRGFVRLQEPGGADMGVALRGREPAVAEQLLDHPEVGAVVEQVRGERVAQRVRAHAARDAGGADRAPDDRMDRAHAEPPAPMVDEDRPAAGGAPPEIGVQRARGRQLASDGDRVEAARVERGEPGAHVAPGRRTNDADTAREVLQVAAIRPNGMG